MLDAKTEYQIAQNHQSEMREAWQSYCSVGRDRQGKTAKSRIGAKGQQAIKAVITILRSGDQIPSR